MINKVLKELSKIANKQRVNSIVITGGRSAKELYKMWPRDPNFKFFKSSAFYLSDERLVSLQSEDSNYKMIKSSLGKLISSDQIFKINGESKNFKSEAKRYDKIIPDKIDVVLLSVGEDGHIASLFPKSKALRCNSKVTYLTNSPKLPSKRLTITPKIILNAKNVLVMAKGKNKGNILAQALTSPLDINILPVRLTIGRTWLLDYEAYRAFKKYKIKQTYNTKIINSDKKKAYIY